MIDPWQGPKYVSPFYNAIWNNVLNNRQVKFVDDSL